jgi:hypothetical protein
MANTQNLIPGGHKLTQEEQSMGGIASGKARRRNAIIRNSLQNILNSGIKIPIVDPDKPIDKDIENLLTKLKAIGVDTENISLVDLMNLGQILGSMFGKPECYRALLESSGELIEGEETQVPTPSLEITIKDNSHLEKDLYEANKH